MKERNTSALSRIDQMEALEAAAAGIKEEQLYYLRQTLFQVLSMLLRLNTAHVVSTKYMILWSPLMEKRGFFKSIVMQNPAYYLKAFGEITLLYIEKVSGEEGVVSVTEAVPASGELFDFEALREQVVKALEEVIDIMKKGDEQ